MEVSLVTYREIRLRKRFDRARYPECRETISTGTSCSIRLTRRSGEGMSRPTALASCCLPHWLLFVPRLLRHRVHRARLDHLLIEVALLLQLVIRLQVHPSHDLRHRHRDARLLRL